MKNIKNIILVFIGLTFSLQSNSNIIISEDQLATTQNTRYLLAGVMDLSRKLNTDTLAIQSSYIISAEIASRDTDGDGFIEPFAGNNSGAASAGGELPLSSSAPRVDGYGHALRYCAWDNGSVRADATLITGSNIPSMTQPIFSVIALGTNGVLETSCASAYAGIAVGDDKLVTMNSAQLKQGVGGTQYFGDPVADLTALNALSVASLRDGELRLLKSDNSMYRYRAGTGWQSITGAIASGEVNGDLKVNPSSGAGTGNSITFNSTGTVASVITSDSTGTLALSPGGQLVVQASGGGPSPLTIITAGGSGSSMGNAIFEGKIFAKAGITSSANGAYADTNNFVAYDANLAGTTNGVAFKTDISTNTSGTPRTGLKIITNNDPSYSNFQIPILVENSTTGEPLFKVNNSGNVLVQSLQIPDWQNITNIDANIKMNFGGDNFYIDNNRLLIDGSATGGLDGAIMMSAAQIQLNDYYSPDGMLYTSAPMLVLSRSIGARFQDNQYLKNYTVKYNNGTARYAFTTNATSGYSFDKNVVSTGGFTGNLTGTASSATGFASWGPIATRPAASIANRVFLSVDTLALYRDTGATWQLIMPAFTGDATSTAGSTALTLANSGVTAGSYGSATAVPVITFDAKGRATTASSVTVTPAWTSITGIPAGISSYAANMNQNVRTTDAVTFNSVTAAGGFIGNASTASNLSQPATTLATATESNAITIAAPSYSTDKPVKLLNFDWYGNRWSLGNIRSGSSASNGLGVFATEVERYRFTEGAFYVNQGQNNSRIYMVDTDDGTRSIHNNSGTIGFLNSTGGWLQRNWDSGTFKTYDPSGNVLFEARNDGTIWTTRYGNLENAFVSQYTGSIDNTNLNTNGLLTGTYGMFGTWGPNNPGVYAYGVMQTLNTNGSAGIAQIYYPHNASGDQGVWYRSGWQNAGWSGTWRRFLDSNIDIYAASMNQHVRTTDSPTFAGATFAGQVNVNGELYMGSGNWIRSQGDSGLYFQSWGGGWRMTDSSWIRAYGDKGIYTGGQIKADGGFILPDNNDFGLRNSTNTAWVRIQDGGNNMHLKAVDSFYSDANNHYFRSQNGGTTYATINSSGLIANAGTVYANNFYPIGGGPSSLTLSSSGGGYAEAYQLKARAGGLNISGITNPTNTSNSAIYVDVGWGGSSGYHGIKSSSAAGTGVWGVTTAGSWSSYGIRGDSTVDAGVIGFTSYAGSGSAGVIGRTSHGTTASSGVRGETTSTNSISTGVMGTATTGMGVWGTSSGGNGVYGVTSAVGYYGVYGTAASGTGVRGESNSASYYGVQAYNSTATGVALYCSATAAGGCAGNKGWTNSSDGRLKTNVVTIGNALDTINHLRGVRFNWNQLGHDLQQQDMNERNIGFIAQELEPYVPELVVTRPDGYKAVNYAQMTAVLVEGIKEQNAQFKAEKQFTIDRFAVVDGQLMVINDKMAVTEAKLETLNTLTQKHDTDITRLLDDVKKHEAVLTYMRVTAKNGTDTVLTADNSQLNIDVPVFVKNNITAEMVEAQVIKAKKIKAELAEIAELNADKITAKEAVLDKAYTGLNEFNATLGFWSPVMNTVNQGSYMLTLAGTDGSYASVTVLNSNGKLSVVTLAAKGLKVDLINNKVQATHETAATHVKASWLKTG